MNITRLLPISEARLKVLFEIYSNKEDYLRNISKDIKMNPSLTYKILKNLTKLNIVSKEEKGKEIVYTFEKSYDNILLRSILEEYYLEKQIKKQLLLGTVVKLIRENKRLECDRIFIFGSILSGDFKKDSDIDILFVGGSKTEIINSCREISSLVDRTLNPLIYTKEKFDKELSSKEALIDSIVNKIRSRVVVK